MKIERLDIDGYEEVLRVEDPDLRLLAFIAVHSTRLGPAAGGMRMRPYADERAALHDVLRLSRGMTYKNAAADLPLGGGKAVVVGDPAHDKSPAMLAALGRAIATLDGRYWTAEDMGMSPEDMAVMAAETPYVAGLASGQFASGDPSPITARGVFNAIGVTARRALARTDLSGLTIAVQGLGHVGEHLCRQLADAGCGLIVADTDAGRADRVARGCGGQVVAPDEIVAQGADVFAPCAVGGILNERSIPTLKVGAVAGGANNQLETLDDGDRLHAHGILYAPDYIVNGGGIINVATEILRVEDREPYVTRHLKSLEATLERVLETAKQEDVSPARVADRTVEAILAEKRPA
ncbi:Glu/Leu/Phe/Val family dehydrogenase [Tranquillimonas alkanivorans]|uniref:Leucine dehydrogenase n=1 Tax=Tranquillimonas alkanivorans TaxID=441119 RepID=A0A1I5P3B1_9RHOB|nr:Glu/Leu/Phe/Val dehydrogenase dimerization domain-containing protein [Tranquillimonas alkanivorans]SFP28340.1 leucine dehydrogenase [Tranquillimonas alkanivorans]